MTHHTCLRCDEPATLVNHTQFAGTHYWCTEHVPPGDRDECTPLEVEPEQPKSLILDPANLTTKFTDFGGGGFTGKPTTYLCEVYYHDTNGDYRAEATERSAHRAKMAALNDLETMVVNRAQESVKQDTEVPELDTEFDEFIKVVAKEWAKTRNPLNNYQKGYNQAIKDTIGYLEKLLHK